MKIFLSGGTHGDWQQKVKDEFCGIEFFDPRLVRGTTMAEIATEEVQWLNRTDILFFYFEESNPSGLGSAFEVGYCAARGIPVIFVDEKETSHSEWLGVHCDIVVHSFQDGIQKLREKISEVSKVKG